MERISGPYKGHFIAAYTVNAGAQVNGYAKICSEAPASVWVSDGVEKLISIIGCHDEQEALRIAERKAREAIGDIVGNADPISIPGELR